MLGIAMFSKRIAQQDSAPVKAVKQNPGDGVNCGQLLRRRVPLSPHELCGRRGEETNQNESPRAGRSRCCKEDQKFETAWRFDSVNLVRNSRQWPQKNRNDPT